MAREFIQPYNNLLIVDGLNLAFRWKHAKKVGWAAEYLQTIISFANSYKAKEVVVLSDAGSEYRKSIYPLYKANREELRENQTKEEAEEFEQFLNDWALAFELCGTKYTTIKFSGVEADDIAAYITLQDCVLNNYEHIWLLSTDADWDLLVNDKVSRFSYRSRKEITIQNWYEHHDYSQEEHISIKVLQGDKSDNVPGVKGIGEKRAAALIRTYGSAFDIHAQLPIKDSRKFMQNLNEFKDQIILNYELMDLHQCCVPALLEHVDELDDIIRDKLC